MQVERATIGVNIVARLDSEGQTFLSSLLKKNDGISFLFLFLWKKIYKSRPENATAKLQ